MLCFPQLTLHCPLEPDTFGPTSLRHSAAASWCMKVLQAVSPAVC